MTLTQAILATLSYHDIFDYPLNAQEIHKYLIGEQASLQNIEKTLEKLTGIKKLGESNGFYFLKNRVKISQVRRTRKAYSIGKLKKAYFYATLLMLIPTLKMVAISGALAMENSHKDDDIDFVLISSRGSLWTTRFLANIILFPFKRKPQEKGSTLNATNNKACLNLFLDESDLSIKNRNLYTAHELVQMKVLWERDKTYSRLLKSNDWVTKFLPNWQAEKSSQKGKLSTFQFSILEFFLKKFQLAYMRKKVSTEQIGDTQLFFHPRNTQKIIMEKYQKNLKAQKLTR